MRNSSGSGGTPCDVTEASRYLRALAANVAAAYATHTKPHAILLAGSAAHGVSDFYSDVDLIVYYGGPLPSDADLARARDSIRCTSFRVRSPQDNGTYVEEFVVRGVECEALHITVATWEKQMDSVLRECTPASLIQAALSGLLDGRALLGEDLIGAWKTRAASYPKGLTRAMVEHYLRFFPMWRSHERIAARDATLWHYQTLVETSQNLLGVLAGLNEVYYVPFQLKRLRRLVGRMRIAPEHLASRLEALFVLDEASASREMQQLVAETLLLVETHLPDIDTTEVRRSIGDRQTRWSPTA